MSNTTKSILLIDKSGRIDAIADALKRSSHPVKLYAISEVMNPGLLAKCEEPPALGRTDDRQFVAKVARRVCPDFVVIGPEEPLAAGVVDELRSLGIPSVGPSQKLAQIESSKSFARNLLDKYQIPGNPQFRVFRDTDGLEKYLRLLGAFVIKPDGLTGGKGVKVFGEHIHSIEEALAYCRSIVDPEHPSFVVEEKLDGEEFSYHSFCDGNTVVHTIPVQDHKRAFDNDVGPNTGGMGTYSCENHLLPFLSADDIEQAARINSAVARALKKELGEEYKGILYGGFMATRNGVRLIEYNARFGDPEAMNLLTLLKTDFVDICEAIIGGTLQTLDVKFAQKATVCKYVVPREYPGAVAVSSKIAINDRASRDENHRIFFGAVKQEGTDYYMTGSRAIACVGLGDTLSEAERRAEKLASSITGDVRYRRDIGTAPLVQRRVEHMRRIRPERSEDEVALIRPVARAATFGDQKSASQS